MYSSKFKLKYDEEYDNLFIYNLVKKASFGVELEGPLDISCGQKGKLVNLGLNNASDFLSNLTKKKITKRTLAKINDCKINILEKAGLLYITFKFYFKEKELALIEDTLTVKSMNYQSPVSAGA